MKAFDRAVMVAVLVASLSVAAFASDVTIPNVFSAGQTASAAAVNANFAAVAAAINDNDARLDALAAGGVTSAYIADGAVSTTKIANSAVTGAKIGTATITATNIADGAVTSAKIADGTIATADIANSAVTGAKIADSTITAAKINTSSLAANFLLATRRPVVATASGSSVTISSTSVASLASVSITVPSAGTVVVTGNCFVNVTHSTSHGSHYIVGVSNASTNWAEYTMAGVPQAAGAGMYLLSTSVSWTSSVGSAGTYTYYLVGAKYESANPSASAVRSRITAVFIPN